MKISDNTHPISINKMPKFKHFWICNKREIATFLRGTKTFWITLYVSIFNYLDTKFCDIGYVCISDMGTVFAISFVLLI
jgi:hypothetical protein